ncbi:unnamed protein product [Arabidopsis lyrata]|uniref:PRMT5 TIM barrel domain-containing protein n=1 Tax=Arabidopsis lyrata subsp. lyrata TaxID=81972 RepID=D7KY48_ARALL|nr:hypothetical protein ARALYDRAFT_911622 [Arabidopsis lyrata subsp. lyrata]EFH65046.1 hypothetical protein ARALYDRAFT_894876 [Arabidopsis lyrata subsp. lyrata]CAH8273085.1 unnamed protein product [Arabidopsis lyrata]
MGKISSWTDLDSEDEVLRMDSETTLKQEVAWATHFSLHNGIILIQIFIWFQSCLFCFNLQSTKIILSPGI